MKDFIKNIMPKWLLRELRPVYHGLAARYAAMFYGYPSKKMVVIGITGTSGKSTTVAMLSHILNFVGKKTGHSTTASFFDGDTEHVNEHGLSMPSGVMLQEQLVQMVGNGCQYVIVECTSEGLEQNRHKGIHFDVALFTNLSKAHLDSHGGFEKYKAAKHKLFIALERSIRKVIFPRKVIGVNLDDGESAEFLKYNAEEKFGVTLSEAAKDVTLEKIFAASKIKTSPSISFETGGVQFTLGLLGGFNIYNALLAASCAAMLEIPLVEAARALAEFKGVPGRMERIENTLGLTIFVDYAPEPVGLRGALEAVNRESHGRIIHVFGSTGGTRDVGKRFEFGKISAEMADLIIITNDDVYDSDPEEIANNIEQGIRDAKNKRAQQVVKKLNRRVAIHEALMFANPKDVVIITGKGSEQFLVEPGNKRISWDDRNVVREELGYIQMDKNKQLGPV
jgi:UDP-N-acetylmuramoyl-L-alanyl-D-glutamate--2,6-diaminopimelate ligase